MAQADMRYFDQYVLPALPEAIDQQIQKFNEASAGAIRLTRDGFDGDFMQQSFFNSLASAQRRVERYASPNATVNPTPLTNEVVTSVKIAGGFGPIEFEPGQISWLRKPTALGVATAVRQLTDLIVQDELNTAIMALVAAVGNNANTTHDGVNDINRQVALNNAHAKFGDASHNIVANVMSGQTYHKLIDESLVNAQRLYQSGRVTVVDILGKRFVVTDAPALRDLGSPLQSPPEAYVLGLVAGAATVHDEGDLITNFETSNGKERIVSTFQADYTFGLGLKGYAWNDDPSPSDAALATGSNWLKAVSSDKHTAGVLAKVAA